uniref:Uncharacterized protein n=1 Tax=Anopheles dirus TaxID=7168 RepID=A0A182NXH3_9DIPT
KRRHGWFSLENTTVSAGCRRSARVGTANNAPWWHCFDVLSVIVFNCRVLAVDRTSTRR